MGAWHLKSRWNGRYSSEGRAFNAQPPVPLESYRLKTALVLMLGLLFLAVPASAQMPILGSLEDAPPNVTPENLEAFVASVNADFDPHSGPFAGIATVYRHWGNTYGIRWDYAFFQMILETGYLRFGGGVAADDFNFSGVGATVAGKPGRGFRISSAASSRISNTSPSTR